MFLLTAPARALQSLLWAMLSSSLSLAPLAAPWGKPTSLVPRILILTSLITFRHDPGRCGIRHITWLPKYLSGKTPEIQGTLVSKNQSWTESYSFLPWIIQSIFFFFPTSCPQKSCMPGSTTCWFFFEANIGMPHILPAPQFLCFLILAALGMQLPNKALAH